MMEMTGRTRPNTKLSKIIIVVVAAAGCFLCAYRQQSRNGMTQSTKAPPDIPLRSRQSASELTTENYDRVAADGTSKILSVNLGQALAGNPIDNVAQMPRDRLLIHRNAERVEPPTVNITGEELIHKAGGLQRSADTTVADLTRYSMNGKPGEHLEVSLHSVINGNSTEDAPLRMGDVVGHSPSSRMGRHRGNRDRSRRSARSGVLWDSAWREIKFRLPDYCWRSPVLMALGLAISARASPKISQFAFGPSARLGSLRIL
jgi:hypothetical protein